MVSLVSKIYIISNLYYKKTDTHHSVMDKMAEILNVSNTVLDIQDENNVLEKLPVSSHGNYFISIQ